MDVFDVYFCCRYHGRVSHPGIGHDQSSLSRGSQVNNGNGNLGVVVESKRSNPVLVLRLSACPREYRPRAFFLTQCPSYINCKSVKKFYISILTRLIGSPRCVVKNAHLDSLSRQKSNGGAINRVKTQTAARDRLSKIKKLIDSKTYPNLITKVLVYSNPTTKVLVHPLF